MELKTMDENQSNQSQLPPPPRMGLPAKSLPNAGNPLAKHFRQPAIYLQLPSKGKYWEPNSLDLGESGELAIYPMTTKDEITLRTPDALINGQGVVEVIQSCVPAIKNAWKMPSVDTDAVLIAMRIASYGHSMDFEGTCPKCSQTSTYGMDLRTLLAAIKCPDFDTIMDLQAVNIKFRPQSYLQSTQINQAQFEMQKYDKLINSMTDEDVEEKTKIASAQVKRLNELATEMLTNATEYIIDVESGSRIDRKDFIKEFYSNIESKVVQQVNEWLGELIKDSSPKMQKVNCADCGEEIELQIMFDYSNFFVVGF
jgi:hypothetical protein